jgi:cell division protease FtsH
MLPQGREYSEETAREIDVAVRDLVEEALERALAILRARRDVLERTARLLLEKETLKGEDLPKLEPLPPVPQAA